MDRYFASQPQMLGGFPVPDTVRLLTLREIEDFGLKPLDRENKASFCAWAKKRDTEAVGLLKRCCPNTFIKEQLAAFIAAEVELCFPVPEAIGIARADFPLTQSDPFYLFSPVLGHKPEIVSYAISKRLNVLDKLLPAQMSASLPLCWLFDNPDGQMSNIVLSHANPSCSSNSAFLYLIDFAKSRLDYPVMEGERDCLTLHRSWCMVELGLPFIPQAFEATAKKLVGMGSDQLKENVERVFRNIPSHYAESRRTLCLDRTKEVLATNLASLRSELQAGRAIKNIQEIYQREMDYYAQYNLYPRRQSCLYVSTPA